MTISYKIKLPTEVRKAKPKYFKTPAQYLYGSIKFTIQISFAKNREFF